MKYIKTYEDLREPNIGDYVIMTTTKNDKDLKDFLKKNIGNCVNIGEHGIYVEYYDIPSKLKDWFINNIRNFGIESIIRYATEKEIDKIKLEETERKYNL